MNEPASNASSLSCYAEADYPGINPKSLPITLYSPVERPIQKYSLDEYFETKRGNKISRDAVLNGTRYIQLHRMVIIKSGAVVRGDMAAIILGPYSIVEEGAILRPAPQRGKSGSVFCPMNVGSHVLIEKGAVVEAASIGSFVRICRFAIIGPLCVIKDCCVICEGAVLPPRTVVPAHTLVLPGCPSVATLDLPYSFRDVQTQFVNDYHSSFQLVEHL